MISITMVMPTRTTTIKLTISIKQNPTIPEMPNLSKREIKYVFDDDDDVCDDDDDDDKNDDKIDDDHNSDDNDVNIVDCNDKFNRIMIIFQTRPAYESS